MIIAYIYTGEVSVDDHLVSDFMDLVDKYQLIGFGRNAAGPPNVQVTAIGATNPFNISPNRQRKRPRNVHVTPLTTMPNDADDERSVSSSSQKMPKQEVQAGRCTLAASAVRIVLDLSRIIPGKTDLCVSLTRSRSF